MAKLRLLFTIKRKEKYAAVIYSAFLENADHLPVDLIRQFMVQPVSCLFIEHGVHMVLFQDFSSADLLKRILRADQVGYLVPDPVHLFRGERVELVVSHSHVVEAL